MRVRANRPEAGITGPPHWSSPFLVACPREAGHVAEEREYSLQIGHGKIRGIGAGYPKPGHLRLVRRSLERTVVNGGYLNRSFPARDVTEVTSQIGTLYPPPPPKPRYTRTPWPEQKHQWRPSGLLHSYIPLERTDSVREWAQDHIRPPSGWEVISASDSLRANKRQFIPLAIGPKCLVTPLPPPFLRGVLPQREATPALASGRFPCSRGCRRTRVKFVLPEVDSFEVDKKNLLIPDPLPLRRLCARRDLEVLEQVGQPMR